jgi:hypothetical protein
MMTWRAISEEESKESFLTEEHKKASKTIY